MRKREVIKGVRKVYERERRRNIQLQDINRWRERKQYLDIYKHSVMYCKMDYNAHKL